jgi:melanoma-associated antigen p97
MKEGNMKIVDCNNHVKNAIEFFGRSCAVNSLINKYNPIGDNSDKLCQLCIGKVPGGWCNSADPYIGFDGAFKCLMEAGEVAFLKHTTVKEMTESKSFRGVSTDQFQLLCKNGQRMPVSDYLQCNWGMVPSNAIVTSSARTPEQRRKYQKFLEKALQLYSHKQSSNSTYSSDRLNGNDRFNNRDRFNINSNERFNDRYSTTTQRNYNVRNRDPFGISSTTEIPTNDTQLYENFELFDSSRYGTRLNLMFQVRISQNSIIHLVEGFLGFRKNFAISRNFSRLF